MPRIPREVHATIRQRVDGGEKVAAVAASLGCTPANIYAILAKVRRQEGDGGDLLVPSTAVTVVPPAPAEMPPNPVLAVTASVVPTVAAVSVRPAPAEPSATLAAPSAPRHSSLRSPPPAAPSSPVGAPAAKVGGSASSSPNPRGSRGGFALMMRTGDGEEAVNPFRSLDELLSAAKPILRTAARSPEPVWFSIQCVDLDTLEEAF